MKDNSTLLTDSTRYICIIPNAWGKGHTAQEAYKNAKSNGSRGRQAWKYIASYNARIDKQVQMDSMGYLFAPKDSLTVIVDTRRKK